MLDKLHERGVLPRLTLPDNFQPRPELVDEWRKNGYNNLEVALENPNFADEMRVRFQEAQLQFFAPVLETRTATREARNTAAAPECAQCGKQNPSYWREDEHRRVRLDARTGYLT